MSFLNCGTAVGARPTLCYWLNEYESIQQEYLTAVQDMGVQFADEGALAGEISRAKQQLRKSGAIFRNGDASISTGNLSKACIACTGDCGSKTFYLSLACNRNCYFCFNSNQAEFKEGVKLKADWRASLDAYFSSVGGSGNVSCIGLTGGEPLLHKQEAIAFIQYVRSCCPQAHIRLYTAGDFLDVETLTALRNAGLNELRLSVKIDVFDSKELQQQVVQEAASRIQTCARYIPEAMVEMPVIPGTQVAMAKLLEALDEAGAWGINLLEFGYPFNDWVAFQRRGFMIKNPPYPVIYDWDYAGGLPVHGSELLALQLLQYASDKKLRLGVHYCSLENKNRDQVISQNRLFTPDPCIYVQDKNDYFYKTLKVFDCDLSLVKSAMNKARAGSYCKQSQDCLLVHPKYLTLLHEVGAVPAMSFNIVESTSGNGTAGDGFDAHDGGGGAREVSLRELKLELA